MCRNLEFVFLTCTALFAAGCEPCLESGKNGVPDPESGEYQLVVNNKVSRNTPVFVDGEEVGLVCEETNNVTIGNFPVSTCSTIMFHSRVSQSDCYISPNCTQYCENQECAPDTCADTTGFSGIILPIGLVWGS
ncbi:MAG TPA: hypothetical protein VM425_13975 [Myxococcota bacterium]|nr:hypothetical protein [Myxococcota bacterium]